MKEVRILGQDIARKEIEKALGSWLDSFQCEFKKVLLLPPDYTRSLSQAGLVTQILYEKLSPDVQVDIMPALGTHVPVSDEERLKMFGGNIPKERFIDHNWRDDVEEIGEIPSSYVKEISQGMVDFPISVEVNKRLFDTSYDLIVSIGQVLPHEVVGMANYTKNILVGCGGKGVIDKSHFLGAVYGLENLMGKDHSPVRKVFDYAEAHFLKDIPLQYILTVTTTDEDETRIRGLWAGRRRELFEEAVRLSQELNFTLLEKPLEKVVVYLDPEHYKSTWLGNKAIYRTRMAIADDGELIIIAPGIRQFGEDKAIDALIRKYGYSGTPRILELVNKEDDLRDNLSAAAHLIHGSSEGRFKITYAPGHLTREEIEGVNFKYMALSEALRLYTPETLHEGYNTIDGKEVFFIGNPGKGLWALRRRFFNEG